MGAETNANSGEGWRVSVSVSMLLEVTTITRGELDDVPSLLLVRDRADQKWGLPAGHIKESETFTEAITREFVQETGLPSYSLAFQPSMDSFEMMGGLNVTPICLPDELKTRIGFVYQGHVRDLAQMKKSGWKVENDEDVDRAKPYKYRDVMALIDTELVHRDNLNGALLVAWLVKLHNSLGHNGDSLEVKEEIGEWLLTNTQLAKYGTIVADELFPKDFVRFVPAFLERDYQFYKANLEFDDAEFEEQVRRLKW